MAFCPYVMTGVRWRRSSQSEAIDAYDVTNYFRLEIIAQNPSKKPPQMARGGISRERLKQGSSNFRPLSGTNDSRNLLDIK